MLRLFLNCTFAIAMAVALVSQASATTITIGASKDATIFLAGQDLLSALRSPAEVKNG